MMRKMAVNIPLSTSSLPKNKSCSLSFASAQARKVLILPLSLARKLRKLIQMKTKRLK